MRRSTANPWYSTRLKEVHDASERSDIVHQANRVWTASLGARETIVESYLRSRGLGLGWTGDIRYSKNYHAMASAIRDVRGQLQGVHLTFFGPDGKIERDRQGHKTCRVIGILKGGFVNLGVPTSDKRIIVGEGVETVLSALTLSATGILSGIAGLGTYGLGNLPLMRHWEEIVIAADNDKYGRSAARKLVRRLKVSHVRRMVTVAQPPMPGTDWNDVLKDMQAVHSSHAA